MGNAASWWGEPGRAGWQPEVWQGTAFPGTLAGLVRGGWVLEEPGRAPGALPWPGICQARSPLAWYDSLEARVDGGGAPAGFEGALAGLRAGSVSGKRRIRSTFSLASGSGGLEEDALTLSRGDSLGGVGADVMSGAHGAEGGLQQAGLHQWGAQAHLTRGAHAFGGSISQRGAAAGLAGGEEQAASGQSGAAQWRWRRGGNAWKAGFARGLDRHESVGGTLPFSVREAQETRLSVGFDRTWEERGLGAGVEWTDAQVRRFAGGPFALGSRSVWGVVRAAGPVRGGRLEVAVGAGRNGGVDRFEVAPSAVFEVRARGLAAAFALERVLTPVWADLAPGTAPFLQHAWVATARAANARAAARSVRGSLRAGRVYARALADRLPLEELWLRRGLRPEYGTYDFALAEGGIGWEGRIGGAGVEGFGLAHRSTALPGDLPRTPRADPDAGFRAWLGSRAKFFGGDLGVSLRGELEGVGAREAIGAAGAGAQGGVLRRLPAFLTTGVAVEFTLGDATLVVRGRNLEDRPREQSWTDSATGLPAVAGRRDVRLSFLWRLFD